MKPKSIFKGIARRIFASIFSISVIASTITMPLGIEVNAAEAPSPFTGYLPEITVVTDENGFIHPGIGLTKEILENLRTQIRAQKEPWNTYFNQLLASDTAKKTMTSANQSKADPNKVDIDAFDSQSFNSRFRTDCLNAYTQAILYYITGNEVYRENTMHIIRIWEQMDPVKYVYFTDAHIHTGIELQRMATAAEIMRYTSCQDSSLAWTEEDTAKFTASLITPVTEVFQYKNSYFMNQHLYALVGAISGYIFTGNRDRYNEAVEWFTVNKTAADQGQNGAVKALFRLVDTNALTGEKVEPRVQLVEAGRDQAHGTDDIALVEALSRILMSQRTKVDPAEGTVSTEPGAVGPFEFLDNRILKGADHWAQYMLGYDTPWIPTAAHTDADGNPTIIYKDFASGYRGRIGGNAYDLYYYYKYEAGIDMETEAPYFTEMFKKRLPVWWETLEGGGDYWLYIPEAAEAEGTQYIPKAHVEPYRQIEDRFTNIRGNSSAMQEGDTSFVRMNATEEGSKIALVDSDTSQKTIGFRIRTNGAAKMDITYSINDSITMPDTRNQWRYVTYTMNQYQGLGDLVYFTVKGADVTVDFDYINVNAGTLLTPPVFKEGNAALNLFTYAGSEAAINCDFSATDTNTADVVTYRIDNMPEGAVLNENTGAFSWKPEQTGIYSFAVNASDGISVTTRDVRVTVANDRQSAAAAVIAPYNPDTSYVSSSLDNYNAVYADVMSAITTASDDVFYKKLSDLNDAVAGLQLLTPLLSDGSMNYLNMIANTNILVADIPKLLDNAPDSFAVYTSAVGLAHTIDFGPNFKISASSFRLQVRASFPERIGGVAIFASNDNTLWTRLTPGETAVSEEMQTLAADPRYQNQQFRFLKIYMINPPKDLVIDSSNMLELSEFRIFGQRHEIVNKLSSVSIRVDNGIKNRILLGDLVKLNFTSTESISNVRVSIQGAAAAVQTADNIHWTALANSTRTGWVNFSISYRTADGFDAETSAATDGSKVVVADESDLINNIPGITNLIDPTTTPGRPSEAVTLSQVAALFDGNMDTASDFRNGTNGAGGYITFDFKSGNQVALSKVEVLARQDQTGRIAGVVVKGSNDNSTWADISNKAISSADWQDLIINTTTPYRYIRIYNAASWFGNMSELRFHGSIVNPLQSLLEQAAAIDSGIYTDSSLQALRQVVSAGQSLLNSTSATQTDIDTAVDNLNTALAGLEYIPGMPVLNSLEDQTIIAGNKLTFHVQAVNGAGNVEYGASVLPEGASFNTETQHFEWTPGIAQGGLYNIAFTAAAGGLTSTKTIRLKVIGQPVTQPDDTREITAKMQFSYTMPASDPAGMPLVYSVCNLPAGAVFNVSTGTLTWIPLQSDYGSHLVTFTADNGSFSVSQQVNFKVNLYVLPPDAYTKGSYYGYRKAVEQIEADMNQPGADMVQLASRILQVEGQLVSIGTLPMNTKVTVNESMVDASTVPWSGGGTTASNGWRAFDGNTGTYTDTTANPAWILVTLGAGNEKAIGSVRFYPRSGYESRMNGSIIQGSGDGTTWVDLYTINNVANAAWGTGIITDSMAFGYIRYYSSNGNANVSELEFYERPIDKSLLSLLLNTAAAVDPGLFTEESIEVMQLAAAQANTVEADENAAQAEIDAAAAQVQNALDTLAPLSNSR